MFGCPDVKTTFSFVVMNSIAAITQYPSRALFLGRTSLKGNRLRTLAVHLKTNFNIQNGSVLANKFSRHFLISDDFLPRNWKAKYSSFQVRYK